MSTFNRLQDISSRLDHLESSADWLVRVFSERDTAAAQTGELISTLADDIRCRVLDLVTELEKQVVLSQRN